MRFKNLDLISVILVAALNVGWVQLPNRPWVIGSILGLPLVFVLPGYSLTQILLRKRLSDASHNLILPPILKIEHPIGIVDHITLSLGLSMAIDITVGFTLNLFSVGLQAQSWSVSLGVVTIVFALLAVYLRRKYGIGIGKIPGFRIRTHQYILFGVAITVAALAIWYSTIRPLQPQPSFTQFWLLPSMRANNSCAILIGIQSYEATPVAYRVVLKINGVQVNSWSSVVLTPQAKWDQFVSVKPEAATSIYIEAQLYRVDEPDNIYRDTHLIMYSVEQHKNDEERQCTS